MHSTPSMASRDERRKMGLYCIIVSGGALS